MHYKIHEVAKMMGISPQTLRFYEQYGILPHERIGEGKYRQYSDESVDLLMSLRKCRNCGFTVAQTAELLQSCDSTQVTRLIAAQAERLERHAELEQRIAQRMRDAVSRTETLEDRLESHALRTRPVAYWLPVKRGDGRPSPVDMEHIGDLADWLPLIQWVMRFRDAGDGIDMGFAADAETASFLGFDTLKGVERVEACPCVYTLLRWTSGQEGARREMRRRGEALRAEGFALEGSAMVCTLWNLRAEGCGMSYGECWYPLVKI